MVTSLIVVTPLVKAQETTQSEREELYLRYMRFRSYIKGGIIEPHWMEDGNSFWFSEDSPENTVIYLVDPTANKKTELFETVRLRKAIADVLGHEPPYKGVPFSKFIFLKGEKAVEFNIEDKDFILELNNYSISEAPKPSAREKRLWGPKGNEVLSPDGRWIATVKDYNLWLRSTSDGSEVQITKDGIKDYEWTFRYRPVWSPDGSKLAIGKVDRLKVPKMPIIHWLKTPEEVEWIPFERPGFPRRRYELFILDIHTEDQLQVNIGEESDPWLLVSEWKPDGLELFFWRVNRRANRYVLMAANPFNGSSRIVLTEKTQTNFLHSPILWYWGGINFIQDGKRFIHASEADGWNHLYLYDLDGRLIQQLTKGELEVLWTVAIDNASRWIYFITCGSGERPYDKHLYRINFEGQKLERLTEASANHWSTGGWSDPRQTIRFSPSKQFFLDTYSTMNQPTIVELRKADGKLLQTLSRANIDALEKELKWSPPEEFIVKAADGKTDLFGVLYKPYDFDLSKKYPVIEWIYSTNGVPRIFISDPAFRHAQALARQGFIVFIVDGRGTFYRGKEFREAFYESGYQGFSIIDHVATIKQLAQERDYMDLSRVGVLGYSNGGIPALLAMLQAPDVYHVGIAGAPVDVDPYTSMGNWMEAFYGLPQNNPERYEKASLLRLVKSLKGKLLLIHPTGDVACPFSHTMKMVDALIQADKPYDLLIFPEEVHGLYRKPESYKYYLLAILRYFVEHLKPDNN